MRAYYLFLTGAFPFYSSYFTDVRLTVKSVSIHPYNLLSMVSCTSKALVTFRNSIPSARFQTYLNATDSLENAVALYLWNIEASSAVTQMPGLVEVLFRHTVDQCLQSWNVSQCNSYEWITQPAEPLQHLVRPTPPQSWQPTRSNPLPSSWWEARAECSNPQPNHHDLVAGLSFGTWTSLLPKPTARSHRNSRVSIWNDALEAGFGGTPREAIYRWAHEIRIMRNRASHLRPMLDIQRLRRFHKYSIRLLRSMNEDFSQIIAGLALVPDIIKVKP